MKPLEERDLTKFIADVDSMTITSIDHRVIRTLCADLLERKRKEKEQLEQLKHWHQTAPIQFVDKSNEAFDKALELLRESIIHAEMPARLNRKVIEFLKDYNNDQK